MARPPSGLPWRRPGQAGRLSVKTAPSGGDRLSHVCGVAALKRRPAGHRPVRFEAGDKLRQSGQPALPGQPQRGHGSTDALGKTNRRHARPVCTRQADDRDGIRCGPAHSRWIADRIPHATAHFPADQDHANVEENNRSAAIAWVRKHM